MFIVRVKNPFIFLTNIVLQRVIFFWCIYVAYGLFSPMSQVKLRARKVVAWMAILLVLTWNIPEAFCSNSNTASLPISSSNEDNFSSTSVIIYPVKDNISDNVTKDAAAALQAVLPKIANVYVISPKLVDNVLSYYQKSTNEPSDEKKNAFEKLAQAKEHYFSFQYDEALVEVSSAVEYFSQSNIAENGMILQDALLTQGVIAKSAGDKNLTIKAFQRAVQIDPFYKIDRMAFAPSIVAIYESEQQKIVQQAGGSLKIETTPPAAEVYINGILKGVTPFNVQKIPDGSYSLMIKTNRYYPIEKTIIISQGQESVLNEKLRWIKEDAKVSDNKVTDAQSQIREGARIGQLLKADKVILVNCDEVKGDNVVVARMIDIKYRAAYRGIIYSYNAVEERAQAIAGVAEVLGYQANAKLLNDPMKYLDPDGLGDPLLLGARRKKFYKSPIFWGAIGLAVAGAIAGGVAAALSSGGSSGSSGSVNVQFK